MMCEEKPVGIMLPSWNLDDPRFVVEECPMCSDDRQFKNGLCVYNQRLGFAYSVEELVEVLNALGDFEDGAREFIRNTYLTLKNASEEELYSREVLLELFRVVAEKLEIDLKEYPKLSLKDLLGEMNE